MGNLFSKKPDDYENVLAKLAESIDKKKAQLADIRLRERRTTLLFTLYSLFLWIGYSAAWYFELLPRSWGRSDTLKVLRAMPVGVVPVVILSIRRLVQGFYAWRASSEERALKTLLDDQKKKIAEIKKKTNYDSTRSLLERYGETSARPDQPSPLRQRLPPGVAPGSQPPTQPSTPSRPMDQPAAGTPPMGLPGPLPPYMRPSGAALPPPQTRKWYDTLADALLGPDEQAASREKYALICAKCFNHNGLVAPSDWEDIQYTCPKCGYFNPSRRSLRLGQAAMSPTSPATPPPASSAPVPAPSTGDFRPNPDGETTTDAGRDAPPSVDVDAPSHDDGMEVDGPSHA